MKDEELAEEIANKRCHEIMCYGHCSFNSPKHHRCGEWHREYNCALEGIKVGKPQWHVLEKDPNDLPKRDKTFVTDVSVTVIVYPLGFAVYYFFDKKWYSNGKEVKVDRWCEIPTFDKE